MDPEIWVVYGGVFTNFNWCALIDGTEVNVKFSSYDDAYKYWKAIAWQNVDNAQHRVFITEFPFQQYPKTKLTS